MINPSPEEEEKMHAAMLAAKPKGKKRKAAAAEADAAEPVAKMKKSSPPSFSTNPNLPAASRALQSSLALEEAKRKSGMSDAVKSLYRDKNSARKETFMTMGTFTRVRLMFRSYRTCVLILSSSMREGPRHMVSCCILRL
jgi:hypothetical protein